MKNFYLIYFCKNPKGYRSYISAKTLKGYKSAIYTLCNANPPSIHYAMLR